MASVGVTRKRRCSSTHPDDPLLRCNGEVTELTTHIEDHGAFTAPGVFRRWPHKEIGIANPERTRTGDDGELVWGGDAPQHYGARDQQVGGNHYRSQKIQVWDVVDEYGLDYYAGLTLKYLLRAGRKGSKLEDLKKARHVLDKMIELEEREE